jgi:hypothetical protein
MTNRRLVVASGLAVAVPAVFAGAYAVHARGGGSTLADRQARVADRGATVMPFDLDRTTHVFAKRSDGGVQTVVADRPDDHSEIASIRRHLREEAAAFRLGSFDDPAAIHGMEMPGLAELRAGFARVRIRYVDVPSGGRIRYSTSDPVLVRALHAWFDTQLMDHGSDAKSG